MAGWSKSPCSSHSWAEYCVTPLSTLYLYFTEQRRRVCVVRTPLVVVISVVVAIDVVSVSVVVAIDVVVVLKFTMVHQSQCA